jgi:hypothetical protein
MQIVKPFFKHFVLHGKNMTDLFVLLNGPS